jgi:hypothetical protein
MACKASTYPGALSKQEKGHQRDSWQMTELQGKTHEHLGGFRGARQARDAAGPRAPWDLHRTVPLNANKSF